VGFILLAKRWGDDERKGSDEGHLWNKFTRDIGCSARGYSQWARWNKTSVHRTGTVIVLMEEHLPLCFEKFAFCARIWSSTEKARDDARCRPRNRNDLMSRQPANMEDINQCWKCLGTGKVKKKNKNKRKGGRKRQTSEAQSSCSGVATLAGSQATKAADVPPSVIEVACPVCKGETRLASRKRRRALAGKDKACGSVSDPRDPPGWVRPGPAPTGSDLAKPDRDQQLCCLVGKWRIFQQIGGYRYSTDDVVTAWVASRAISTSIFNGRFDTDPQTCDGTGSTRPLHCIDIGCGIGSVLMMVAWKLRGGRGRPDDDDTQVQVPKDQTACSRAPCVSIGVEAQPSRLCLAQKSIVFNGIGDRVAALHGDLRSFIPTEIMRPASDTVKSRSDPRDNTSMSESEAAVSTVASTSAEVRADLLQGAIPFGDGGDNGSGAYKIIQDLRSTVSRLLTERNRSQKPVLCAGNSVSLFDLVTGTPPYFDVRQGGLGSQVRDYRRACDHLGQFHHCCICTHCIGFFCKMFV